jgi:zinc transport system substrate-binding protein
MTSDYGLDYYAAFIGCSAESEASFETIAFLSNKTDELSLKSICKIENSDGKIAETIKSTAKSTDLSVITFDSMQSTTANDVKNGVTYLSVMEKNLQALKSALK